MKLSASPTIINEIYSNAKLDVIAVVHKVNDVAEITTKQGKQLSKRELTLVDRSNYSCQLTIWGKQAEQWVHQDNPVVSCKGLKLSDFGGRQFSHLAISCVADPL